MFGYIASVTQAHNTCVHMYLDIASDIQAHDTCLHMCWYIVNVTQAHDTCVHMYLYKASDVPAHMVHVKMWILSGQWPRWPATGAGHGPDGSAPHQYRWADIVWAPCCRDCVMGCCGVLVVFHWPLVARGSHILHLGLGLLRARLLGLCCTAAFDDDDCFYYYKK